MDVYPIPAFSDNYIWALPDKQTMAFDCVDPGEAFPVLQFAKEHQMKLRSMLLTHHHDDHIGGVSELHAAFPEAKIYAPNDSRFPKMSITVYEHQSIQIGQHHFRILFNPGHTSTHISYYEPQQGWLFCGDTLFSAGCGRVFDGTIEQLHQSLLMFKDLPQSTKIFCAHEYTRQNLRFALRVEPENPAIINYSQELEHRTLGCSLPSTLELELSINPFLRTNKSSVINYSLQNGALTSDSLEVFKTLRSQKNTFK
ncbi:hydroxyacylglutathione hydrolase [uncultured Legionella sp.]|uniref:hydroxyacylglutathione hydrolase n=1 Tax=uncultured Legionella sp. TaxID=210934 RepID=UPI002627C60F|nr:hydroxyacylglutathione hydrolase [uncultured Legionella sp.]